MPTRTARRSLIAALCLATLPGCEEERVGASRRIPPPCDSACVAKAEARIGAVVDSFATAHGVVSSWPDALREGRDFHIVAHTLALDAALGSRAIALVGNVEDIWPTQAGIAVRLIPRSPSIYGVRFVVVCPESFKSRLLALSGGEVIGSLLAVAVEEARARPVEHDDELYVTLDVADASAVAKQEARFVVEGRCRQFKNLDS